MVVAAGYLRLRDAAAAGAVFLLSALTAEHGRRAAQVILRCHPER
jgi:hypothetical protein